MITLRDALIANRELIGAQFEKLGKKNRIYLSYDKSAGWSVLQFKGIFGFFRDCCRRYFGFYGSTHWKNIYQAYRAIDATRMNLPHSFCVKIDRCARHALSSHKKNRSCFQFFIEHPGKYQMCAQIGPVHLSVERGAIAHTKGVEAVVATSNVKDEIAKTIGSDREEEFRELALEDEIAVINAGQLSNHGVRKILVCTLPRSFQALGLRDLYHRILDKAHEKGIRSLAFSVAKMGQDQRVGVVDAAETALKVVEQYTYAHPERFDKIKLIVSENDYANVRAMLGR